MFDRVAGILEKNIDVKAAPFRFRDMRIMLVDDDELLRQYQITFLMRLGIVCDTAENGAEALQVLRSAYRNGEKYDVCFVNGCMPEAESLLRELRTMIPKECINIVRLIGMNELPDTEQERICADYVLERPIQQEKIYQCLSNICKERRNE